MMRFFMEYMPYYRRLLKLAAPLIVTQAGQMLVQLADNAMVGHYGTIELAASSFANSIFLLIMVFGAGISVGITPLLGQSYGKDRLVRAASVIKNSLFLSAIVITAIFILAWLLSYAMNNMGQETAVEAAAIPYYRLLSFSLVPMLIFMVFKQIGEGLGNTMYAMLATLASNIINIGLNYLLIFGKAGFPELGLLGAGYASLLSRIIMAALLIPLLLSSKKYAGVFALIRRVPFAKGRMLKIFYTGLPIALQMLIEISLFAAGTIMMGWIGDVPLAAHQVANGMIGFTFMIANGIAMATTIRISWQWGNGNFREMQQAGKASQQMVLAFMGLCAVLFITLAPALARLFSNDPAVWEAAIPLLIIAGLFQIVDGLQVVSLGILRGIADVKKPFWMAAFSYLVFGLPVSYLAAFVLDLGAEGIWLGFISSLSIAALLFGLRIRKMWQKPEFSA
ncbi:MAG: MATE family efflux transporter [Bacteroidales bacterium]